MTISAVISNSKKAEILSLFVDSYTVVDIETTGLNPVKNEIIELSAIKITNNMPEKVFSTLIKPKNPISGFITSLTGISNLMVQNETSIEDVMQSFYDFVGESIILGHNVHFDMNFIRANSKRILNKNFPNKTLDTLKLARKILSDVPNYKLDTLAKYYNISTEGHHRGLTDCQITNKLYQNLRLTAQNMPSD